MGCPRLTRCLLGALRSHLTSPGLSLLFRKMRILPILHTQDILLGPKPPNTPSVLSWKPLCPDSEGGGVWLPDGMMTLWAGEGGRQAFEYWLRQQMF